MKGLAPLPGERRSRGRRFWGVAVGTIMGAVVVFVILDQLFQLREKLAAKHAYAQRSGLAGRDRLLEKAIQERIVLLTRPRDTTAGLGGDTSGRLIEAGLLYGRLALLQEAQGRARESISSMARGVALLKEAGHPDPTEAHIRHMVVQQDEGKAAE